MAKILVIEDEELVRRSFEAIFDSRGDEVFLAKNGLEGLKAFDANPADLVVCDILMPEMEGIETIRELRRRSASVPIISVSGGGRMGNTNFLEIARKCGADAALAKPFSVDELKSLVGRLLES